MTVSNCNRRRQQNSPSKMLTSTSAQTLPAAAVQRKLVQAARAMERLVESLEGLAERMDTDWTIEGDLPRIIESIDQDSGAIRLLHINYRRLARRREMARKGGAQ